ncbi:hypothetical protein OU5_P0452 (plasmid) [Pseudomonas mandelii JR-1]|jgi:hypothetical protein|uniref:Uncharacterized protein n=2 Tax=Pseudomonas TaxID=286 RepID=A0A024ELE6_9PSED|nr:MULTISPECIES: hypothetical protein [Pseudomonas]AHZ73704.1 hypothetical protein OU5_P0452 [Pseudomonas mandelii JR-1]KRP82444.1 hypothetical protein TX25_29610 [Pseudomonas lactis]MBC2384571.1 hypothetical protein [Pseudomonas cremoris]MBV7514462.1 hypothetical protein [Pseudomonas sp. PDM25]MDY7069693.1 hypothetical protein [Pseudomonas extremaustralis]
MNQLQAIYLMELRELLVSDGTVKVPENIAQTVSPDVLDIRYLKRWAVFNNIIPEAAEIGITM